MLKEIQNKQLNYKGGRPSVITELVLSKLREAFAIGCTDEEASRLANIGVSTLYLFQSNNPEFLEEKETLKQEPFLRARKTIFDNLDKIETAKWFMERKNKKEFAQRTEYVEKGLLPYEKLTISEEEFGEVIKEYATNINTQI